MLNIGKFYFICNWINIVFLGISSDENFQTGLIWLEQGDFLFQVTNIALILKEKDSLSGEKMFHLQYLNYYSFLLLYSYLLSFTLFNNIINYN